jgi:hypothetical protein
MKKGVLCTNNKKRRLPFEKVTARRFIAALFLYKKLGKGFLPFYSFRLNGRGSSGFCVVKN